jgi:hypothetical protein
MEPRPELLRVDARKEDQIARCQIHVFPTNRPHGELSIQCLGLT